MKWLRMLGVTLLGIGASAAGFGQQVQVGKLPESPDLVVPVPVGSMIYDRFIGAPAAAVLTTATFDYSNSPCPGAASIQFGRPGMRLLEPPQFFASRGPFDVTERRQTVSLSPPVPVLAGDQIAITRLTGCGTSLGASTQPGLLLILPQGTIISGALALAAFGSAVPYNGIASIIPVVFSGDGVAGSHFRTEVTLYNPSGDSISGDLNFPDPSGFAFEHTYSLGPYEVRALKSLPQFGSIDILPRVGLAPIAIAHLFNDLGSAGTMGLTETGIAPSEALAAGDRGVLLGPTDSVNFRLNTGFRSIGPTGSVVVTVRRSDGSTAATARLSPASLVQVAFQDLVGIPLESAVSVTFEVESGTVLIYGVTADNRTNDVAFQLAQRIRR